MRIVVLTKRQYTNKDVIDDRYGRLWEIPMAMASEGHNVTCICLSYQSKKSGTEVFTTANGQSIRWLSVNLGPLVVFGFLKYFFLAKKIIRAERPDVVWSCSDTIYTVLGRYFATKFKCRSVADLYDNFEYFASYRIPFLRSRYRAAVRDSDGVSCVGQALGQHLKSSYGRNKPTAVITNAVDTELFTPMNKTACREQLGLPRDVQLVGAAGDISNYRGADMLYRAFTERAHELSHVQLAVAGHRNSDTSIPRVDHIHDLDRLAPLDVPVFLNALDVVVIYNRSSTFGDFCFPQKFYEALACQAPVVVANVGELSLLLKGHQSFLYEDGDVASLVAALKRQLELREKLELDVPSWRDQASLLIQLMQTVLRGA